MAARDPRAGAIDCDCYFCVNKEPGQKGLGPCEGYDHHCPMCHGARGCTKDPCRLEFAQTLPTIAERRPAPKVR